MKSKTYKFKADMWKYKFDGATAWHFITLPKDISAEIKFLAADKKSPWGSLRVSAHIGKTKWSTSLFPDSKHGSYLLPVKAEVRKAEDLKDGTAVTCTIIRET
jgi:Domain of unknown function (DUF1905)